MNFRKLLSDNLPILLTSTAISGVISTAALAVKATPKATRDIWDAQSEFGRELTKLEVVRLTWQYYTPAVIMGGLTIGAIITLRGVDAKRQAAIAGLYSLTDKAFTEYKERVIQEIGESKESKIQDEIAKTHIEENPITSSEVIITGAGKHLCYDSVTGRYFESDIETIRRAVNDINLKCINEMYAEQNDFYRLIGLPITAYGAEVGWRTDHPLDIHFSSHITEDGRPCLSLDYRLQPIHGYYKINY